MNTWWTPLLWNLLLILYSMVLKNWTLCFREFLTFCFPSKKNGYAKVFQCLTLQSLCESWNKQREMWSATLSDQCAQLWMPAVQFLLMVRVSVLATAASWPLGSPCLILTPAFLALLWGLQRPDSGRVKLGRESKQNAAHVTGNNTDVFAHLHVNCCTCSVSVNTMRLLQLLNWLLQGSALWIAFGLRVSCPST